MMIHHISPRRIARNTGPLKSNVGVFYKNVWLKTGKRVNQSSSKTHSLSVMMPLDHISVNTIF
jgi:hypothetical protein